LLARITTAFARTSNPADSILLYLRQRSHPNKKCNQQTYSGLNMS